MRSKRGTRTDRRRETAGEWSRRIATGLVALLTPQALLFMLIGSIYGLIIGILPGLGGIIAMTLLLPFTFG